MPAGPERWPVVRERGVSWRLGGDAFFRSESGLSRDLGCLALAVRMREKGLGEGAGGGGEAETGVAVLEAFAGSGSRGVRYAAHLPPGSLLWSNDADASLGPTLVYNLAQSERERERERESEGEDSEGLCRQARRVTTRVTHEDVRALLYGCFVRSERFGVVDLDGFGSAGVAVCGVACGVVEDDGLVYVAGTDAATVAGGHNAGSALGSYGGAHCVSKLPFASEQGMRVFLYAVVQAAAAQGRDAFPLFSHYSGHGPVFRTMLRVRRGKPAPSGGMVGSVGYMRYCGACGNAGSVDTSALGGECFASCPSCGAHGTTQVAGPLWIGDLHEREFLARMREEADRLGWTREDPRGNESALGRELAVMEEEVGPGAPEGVAFHIPLDRIASHARLRGTPPRDALLAALPFDACRTSFDTKAIRCGAPLDAIAAAWYDAQNGGSGDV